VTLVKVVDASAYAAMVFGEPAAAEVAARLAGARLVAPQLIEFELANVCFVKAKRSPEQQADVLAAFRNRDLIKIERLLVDYDGVLAIALSSSLSAYDASYLWLARFMDAELVTLDRRLAAVAELS